MARKDARDVAMRLLYQWSITGETAVEQALSLFEDVTLEQEDLVYIGETIRGVLKAREPVDEQIERFSKNWRIQRMPAVDLAVLRLAVYELLEKRDVPPKVVAKEAADLAQKYGNEKSADFVTGLLGRIIAQNALLEDKQDS